MHIGRKILILAIILLFSYIIYSLLQKRKAILSSVQNYYKQKELQIEGFGEQDDPNYDAIMNDIKKISYKITYQIDNDNKPIVYKNYDTTSISDATELKDVFMKASYNSAFTGNYLSSEMVKFCLSQGCRFLDFEVEMSGVPVVVCKNTASGTATNKTKSGAPASISLLEVLKCTLDAAFNENSGSKYPITNINDPLFIHIRCSNDISNNNNDIYKSVYNNVLKKLIADPNYKKYFYLDNSNYLVAHNSGESYRQEAAFYNINLKDLQKKAFIIVYGVNADNDVFIDADSGCNYKYDKTTEKKYNDIIKGTPIGTTGIYKFQMVLSDPTELDVIKPNPDVFTSANKLGYQVTCISYSNYLNEAYLTQNERKYESMFIDFNYSYIKMSDIQSYISNHPLYVQT